MEKPQRAQIDADRDVFKNLRSICAHLRFQFSILSLLLLTVVVAIPCSWLATAMKQAKRQRAAVTAIVKSVPFGFSDIKYATPDTYDWEVDAALNRRPNATPPQPAWLRNLLGNEFFSDVLVVSLNWTWVTDADLEHLEALPRLQQLDLDSTAVGDAGLEHLEGLTQLQHLGLYRTKVSDAGLKHLQGLRQLRYLDLGGLTKVTDAGLAQLPLTQLQWLSLNETKVSDAGLQHLKRLTRLQDLLLHGTRLSGATGLEHLEGLPQLETLDLSGTELNDAGLKYLQGLPGLQVLNLAGTKVTDAGLDTPRPVDPTPRLVSWRHRGHGRRARTPERIAPTPTPVPQLHQRSVTPGWIASKG